MSNISPIDSEAPVNDIVTPIGTSPWILTRSKSQSGRIYYFNTLTGEAVWNLSSADIEKAKSTTKMLNNLPVTNFNNYPEPKEPPSNIHDSCNKQAIQCYTPATVYNKQIINNKYPNPTDAACMGTQCLGCVSFRPPNVWAVPPNHQILIAPSQSPIVNQPQTSLDITYSDMDQMLAQKTSVPHSTQLKTNQYNRFDKWKTWNGGSNINNFGFHQKKFFHKRVLPKTSFYDNNRYFCTSNQDLREKLCSKRQFKVNRSEEAITQGTSSSLTTSQPEHNNLQRIKIITPRLEELPATDVDDIWLKKYAFIQGTQLMLNIQPLRDIVITKQGLSCWYIVIDFTALLKHFNLINIIVNSDKQCQLMISNYVINEVRAASRSTDLNLMNRAIIVLQMLTQQFTAQRAVLGIDSREDCNSILDFCVKLSEQNNNVLLISEDNTSNTSKVNSIVIFTIEELKEILASGHEEANINHFKQVTEPITASINNDRIIEKHVVYLNSKGEEKNVLNLQREIDKASDSNEAAIHLKNTLEMGVQTEHHTVHNTTLQDLKNDSVSNINPSEGPKRRLIRACRLNAKNDKKFDKRHFVWHRKKNNSTIQSVHQETESNQHNEKTSVFNNNASRFGTISDCDNPTLVKDSLNEEGYLYKNFEDNCSEKTDSSIFIQNRGNKIKVIEETSSSGIISNTVSNMDSESDDNIIPATFSSIDSGSDRSIIPAIEINMANYDNMDKCVMFDIESPAMEESLKMKSDEWVSRFVQIMEEVLTEILKLDPPFHCAILPPPWTLHEAAECIKKKFSNDSDIVDSAGKLTNILYKISDGRGKIKLRLEPNEFMEMYSYGVYLIDSLQSNLNDYEDIQTAQESLANLLCDIQDPNAHNAHNDIFSDNNNDNISANVTPSSNADTETKETSTLSQNDRIKDAAHIELNKSLEGTSSKSDRCNFTSAEKKPDVSNEETSVKFIRSMDNESSFFFTLNLKRKPYECNNLKLQETDRERETAKVDTAKDNSLENKDVAGPIVIRNFSKCAEFEERLRQKTKNVELDMDRLDYTQEDLEYDYYEQDYNSDCEYQSYQENQDENDAVEENNDKNNMTDSLTIHEHKINDFKWFASRILNEVKETLLQVHSFCDEARKELEMPEALSSSREQEIQEQAKLAHKQMCNLHSSLNNILKREEKCIDDVDSIQKLFEAEDCENYRHKISKCIEQVSVLLDAVKMVIEATEA